MTKKAGKFGKSKQAPVLCGANLRMGSNDYKFVVGTSIGDLHAFSLATREIVSSVEKAHDGPILSACEGQSSYDFLVTGGKDKAVKVWNETLQLVSSFSMSTLAITDGAVGSLDILPNFVQQSKNRSGHFTLLVGT